MKVITKNDIEYEVVRDKKEYLKVLKPIKEMNRVVIPSEVDGIPVKEIDGRAFAGSLLKELVIKEGVETIGDSAFYHCSSLEYVHLPKSLKTIKSEAFAGCEKLSNVDVQEGLHTIEKFAFANCDLSGAFHFPETLRVIGKNAFKNSLLKEANLGSNLNSIGEYAFSNMEQLKTVTFSEGLKRIGTGAFQNSTMFENISFPESVTYIGYNALDGCDSLKSIYIGPNAKIDSIDDDFAFACISLEQIIVSPKHESYKVIDGILYNTESSALIKVPSMLDKQKITVPEWVELTAFACFEDIQNVKTIVFKGHTIHNLELSYLDTAKNPLTIRCVPGSYVEETIEKMNINISPLTSELTDFLENISEEMKDINIK